MPNGHSPRPQWKTTALHSAIAALCANGLFVNQAQALPSCGPTVNESQSSQCIPYGWDDVTVATGVEITTSNEAAVLYFDDLGGYSEENLIGSLTNNGSIFGEDAAGVYIGHDLIGGLTNNRGIISNSFGEDAVGVYVGRNLMGSLTNHGDITANADGGEGIGIRIDGALNGRLINNGTISAAADGGEGIGVSAEFVGASGTLDNGADAIIAATGQWAAGIFSSGLSGTLNNSGLISAGQDGNAELAEAVVVEYFSGTLNNLGQISARANGGLAVGFLFGNMNNSTLNNYGTIEGLATNGGGGFSLAGFGSEGLNSNITNHQDGVLRGGIYLGGSSIHLSNAGLIDLSNMGYRSEVAGNFTQTETGTLRIMAAGDGENEYSQLYVGGTATIAGKAFVDVQDVKKKLSFGQTLYNVVYTDSETGYLTGNFSTVEDNSALFNFQSLATEGEDGHIDFKIVKAMTAVDAVNANNNPKGLGAAGALDRIIDRGASTPNMQRVVDALGRLGTERQVSDAVSQTMPLLAGNSAIASNSALTGINRVIQSRIESNRGMSSGDAFYGDHKVWLKPFGSLADQNDRNGATGFEANTAGLALGVDGTVSDATRIGVAFAYAKADIDGNSKVAPNSAEVDVYQLLGYGSHSLDRDMELNFQAGIGQNNTAGKRDILFLGETAKAEYSSLVATAGVGLGRTYALSESTDFTPSVRADYTWIKDEGYTEKGSSANLKVDSRSTDELILGLDGKLSHEFMPGMRVSANLGVGYDALNSQSSITASFAGEPGAAFTTRGLEPSPWLQRAGLGLTSNTDNGMEISLRYDAEHRESFLNQTASLKLRWDI
ncbi:autotransporter domain-containing protein [Pseudomonas sp. LPB0260]|uniref:autotransporter outer membrane beta-barrel domain-containing protein n=1 Tax=Pseudomonas sp. LPB0260 TaxID=2614442 RepID=UPI0015C26F40|nr:autotransporter outer membrane beta-barrel domain-containing protein [Pseudomonas sp. LPB0260]QLC72446.1 autotransporter domain-containing protein [Pseudomonas sp. LPB0260]QLC75222.1 autotransporter domain-containing protein [Pseudomonas sp. LPB0260]